MTFAADLERFKLGAVAKTDATVRAVTQNLFNSIVLSSPVDTGRFRGNWQISMTAPITSETERLDPTGATVLAEIAAGIGPAGGKTFLANNLPYAEVIEFGGYPDPVKQGSWVKGVGWVIKSIGGFSKQAPAGCVRVNMTRIQAILRLAQHG